MSDERAGWTYTGPATLIGGDSHGVGGLRVHVDLHVEAEREEVGGVLPGLKSWRGTASLVDPVDAGWLAGACLLVLVDRPQSEAYVTVQRIDGLVTLDLQGVGVPPWLPDADARA